MKVYLHYTIWNKESMIQWFAKGIQYCIPKGSTVDFILDNCWDESRWFCNYLKQKDCPYNLLDYNYNFYESTKSYRWPNTNDAIERFMQSDCDIFLSPQDDQKIQDSNIIGNIQTVFYSYPNVGIIGMRDGIKEGKYWSAHHSSFPKDQLKDITWLPSGHSQPVDEINDGPICLTKGVVDKVGLFDTNSFKCFYGEKDYSFRCLRAGLQPIVMGAEIVHEKWGKVIASTIYTQEIADHDFGNFKLKYPANNPHA